MYRLDVAPARSVAWPWFVRLARHVRRYSVVQEDGVEIHRVETESVASLLALYELVRGWKGWAFYVDDRPAPRSELTRLVWGYTWERNQAGSLRRGLARRDPGPEGEA